MTMHEFSFFVMASALMLFATVAQAQTSLCGNWKQEGSKTEKQDWGQSKTMATESLVLGQDNSFTHSGTLVMTITDNNGAKGNYQLEYSGVGTWKQDGAKLMLTYDPKRSWATEKQNTMDGFFKLLTSALTKEAQKAYKRKKPAAYTVVSVSSSELKIKEVGNDTAETNTFTKQ